MGLEVAHKVFVGNDAGLLEAIHPLSDLDVDIAAWISNGEDGVLGYYLVGNVLEMDPHVLEVGYRFIEVVVDDICGDVAGPFAGIRDDRVKVNLELH